MYPLYFIIQGNQSRQFLKCVALLNEAFIGEGADVAEKGLPFSRALSLFDKIVTSCFGITLDPTYEELISEFREANCDLGITVTPKIHKVLKF